MYGAKYETPKDFKEHKSIKCPNKTMPIPKNPARNPAMVYKNLTILK